MTIAKRAICSKCQRPQSTCICLWIRPLEHQVEVLFLQHPLEVGNAKGSARLLHLSLLHSRLVVGEVFPEHELQALLHEPFDHQDAGEPSNKKIVPMLLYPDTPDGKSVVLPSLLDRAPESEARQYRLVVLDGTWRKSRKMLYLNPLLQQLPRFTLNDPPASHYRIRKAHKPDQLSTFEATCYALMQLEKDAEKYQPLLENFDGFVEQMSRHSPTA